MGAVNAVAISDNGDVITGSFDRFIFCFKNFQTLEPNSDIYE